MKILPMYRSSRFKSLIYSNSQRETRRCYHFRCENYVLADTFDELFCSVFSVALGRG
jgi:hypothetical protein